MSQITPFKIEIPDAQLDDLKQRLANTRWVDAKTVDDWSQGIPLAYMQELCAYWANDYNWRATEARLNQYPQFKTEIEGLELMRWLGERDRKGIAHLKDLLAGGPAVVSLPLLAASPVDLPRLAALGRTLESAWVP